MDLAESSYELRSTLLKGSYIGDYIGLYRVICGYLGFRV